MLVWFSSISILLNIMFHAPMGIFKLELIVSMEKTTYMEIGCHRRIVTNGHITVGSNSY